MARCLLVVVSLFLEVVLSTSLCISKDNHWLASKFSWRGLAMQTWGRGLRAQTLPSVSASRAGRLASSFIPIQSGNSRYGQPNHVESLQILTRFSNASHEPPAYPCLSGHQVQIHGAGLLVLLLPAVPRWVTHRGPKLKFQLCLQLM